MSDDLSGDMLAPSWPNLVFFKYRNIFIYFINIRRFSFSILYFKYLRTLILCVTMFYKTAFYYNIF